MTSATPHELSMRCLALREQLRKHVAVMPELASLLETLDAGQKLLDVALTRESRARRRVELKALKQPMHEARARHRAQHRNPK